MKLIKYFLESILVYLSFILAKLIGISISRKIFSFLFKFLGPVFRKNEIIHNNLLRYKNNISTIERENIKKNMWSNYGMVFVEYIFLSKFRKSKEHINILGEKNLEKVLNKGKLSYLYLGTLLF